MIIPILEALLTTTHWYYVMLLSFICFSSSYYVYNSCFVCTAADRVLRMVCFYFLKTAFILLASSICWADLRASKYLYFLILQVLGSLILLHILRHCRLHVYVGSLTQEKRELSIKIIQDSISHLGLTSVFLYSEAIYLSVWYCVKW